MRVREGGQELLGPDGEQESRLGADWEQTGDEGDDARSSQSPLDNSHTR